MKSTRLVNLATSALSASLVSGVMFFATSGATSSPSPVTYYACNKGGLLSMVGTTSPKCPTGAKAISWGQVGSIGPSGVQGPKGDVGATGAKGESGQVGAQGLTGTQGQTGPQGPKGDAGYVSNACQFIGSPYNLSGCDLHGESIGSGIRGVFEFANFRGANLSNVTFQDGGDFSSAIFASANLQGAILADVNLNGANLTLSNLTGATLTGVISGGIIGTPAVLPSGWLLANGYLFGVGANLQSVNLNEVNLSGVNLNGAAFIFATLTKVDLTGADLTGADFTGATVSKPTYSGNTTCPNGIKYGTSGANCP